MKKLVLLFHCIFFVSYLSFSQNVGIGTANPTSRLHVRETGGGTQIILEENAGSILRISNEANTAGPYIGATSNHSFSMVSNNTVRMVVAANGSVGIGTTNPLTALDVNGSIRIGNSTINQAGSSIRFNNNRFEGYTGSSWRGFEQASVSSVITSRMANDNALLNQGYKYVGAIPGVITRDTIATDVAANTWIPASQSLNYPPPPLTGKSVVWTGDKLLVWGGANMDHENDDPEWSLVKTYAEGYYLDMDANIWDTIKRLPEARCLHSTVWTGTEMIVWGGFLANGLSNNTGTMYDSVTDTWSTLSATNAPSAGYGYASFVNGNSMVLWGGTIGSGSANGHSYNFVTNTWSPYSPGNAISNRMYPSINIASGNVIVFGGHDIGSQNLINEAYRNNTAIHPPVNTAAAASHLFWAGSYLIAYGGFAPNTNSIRNGTNRCTRLFLTAQPVTTITETTRNLFLYQKN